MPRVHYIAPGAFRMLIRFRFSLGAFERNAKRVGDDEEESGRLENACGTELPHGRTAFRVPEQSGVIFNAGWPGPEHGVYLVEWPTELR